MIYYECLSKTITNRPSYYMNPRKNINDSLYNAIIYDDDHAVVQWINLKGRFDTVELTGYDHEELVGLYGESEILNVWVDEASVANIIIPRHLVSVQLLNSIIDSLEKHHYDILYMLSDTIIK